MNASQIRQKYLDFFEARGHVVIPRARLVPDNDPTTLFTGSGMQPLVPHLLGEEHPQGTRLVDSQTCLRSQDIEEIGDNRHTTFFEMLGNWSLGDYFKKEQIPWFWEFLTKEIGLDPERIFVTCHIGDEQADVARDTEAAEIWTGLFKEAGVSHKQVDIGSEADGGRLGGQGGRIFYYDSKKNWWSRSGTPAEMPVGEPGGPTTEMFYLFPSVQHNTKYGEHCHPNCDCGRYIELGNSVFMGFVKTEKGIEKLPKQNVDYGGGLERIAAAAIDSPDVFKISLMQPVIDKLEELSGKSYDAHTNSMRVVSDHLRGAVFLINDGVLPGNKEQGYVLRRLMRRAIYQAFELGIVDNVGSSIAPIVIKMYEDFYPELRSNSNMIQAAIDAEELLFRKTLARGNRELQKMQKRIVEMLNSREVAAQNYLVSGREVFKMWDTYGFPAELTIKEVESWQTLEGEKTHPLTGEWQKEFDEAMQEQRERSRTATKGQFKGGLADHSEITTKYHTATHMMYRALRMVLGDHVEQRGSNITAERLRFDFNHPEKVTREQLDEVEKIVNDEIKKDVPVAWRELPLTEAMELGARGHFGEKYGEIVKMYTIGHEESPYSRELCGGPHVEHTGALAEGGKTFKILKEESSSAGIRRIKAALV